MKKNMKIETDEQKELKRFVIVLVGLIIVVIGIYFFTRAFVTKDLNKNEDDSFKAGKVVDTTVIVGDMLNRVEKEYYVTLYDMEGLEANYYYSLFSNYSSSEEKDKLKIYYADLSNKLNEQYVAKDDEKISTSFKDLESLKLGDITLIKVKNGKVDKFIVDVDDIKNELKIKK